MTLLKIVIGNIGHVRFMFCQLLELWKVRKKVMTVHWAACPCKFLLKEEQSSATCTALAKYLVSLQCSCRTLGKLLALALLQKSDCVLRKLWLHASHVNFQILLVKRILDSSEIVNEGNYKLI